VRDALQRLDALVQTHPELTAPDTQARLDAWVQEKAMSESKGAKSILVRMPKDLIEALDRYAERKKAEQPGTTFSRSDAIRVLLYKAIAAEEAEEREKQS
jgi:hypothetical protein